MEFLKEKMGTFSFILSEETFIDICAEYTAKYI